jgi:hypothetical protein
MGRRLMLRQRRDSLLYLSAHSAKETGGTIGFFAGGGGITSSFAPDTSPFRLPAHAAWSDWKHVAGEQVDLPPDVFAWRAFCGDASIEDLRLAREAAHLKLQAKNGRLKFAEQT